MKNARTEESRNRNRADAANAASVTGQSISDGSVIRSNDGDEQTIDNGSVGSESGTLADKLVTASVSGGYTRNEIASGYYFAPNGDIKPIPDGCYVDAKDGRLKKRRRRNGNNAADGNEDRTNYENREQTGNSSSELDSQVDFRKPLKVRTRRRKTVKEESKKLTMVTLLASGCGALFTSVALITKHDHWQLRTDCQPTEAKILAEAINDALDTLPTKYYDIVTSIVDKWIPWINVCFVLCALIYDRIEQSEKLIERTHYKASERGDKGYTDSATQASNVNSHTSLGYS